jgi:predicted transcriptional regulator
MARSLGINREEVLSLRASGLTIREVAQRLGCSEPAVEYHLYQKMRESIRKSAAKRRKTEKYKKWAREYYMKRYWSDPEFRSKRLEIMREYMRRRYQDPEFRSKALEYKREYRRKRYQSDPEYHHKRLEYEKEYRRRRYWSDPKYRAKYLEYMREYKRRRRLGQKKSGR